MICQYDVNGLSLIILLRSCTPCNRAKATGCLSAEDEWDSSEVINNTAVTPLVPGERE